MIGLGSDNYGHGIDCGYSIHYEKIQIRDIYTILNQSIQGGNGTCECGQIMSMRVCRNSINLIVSRSVGHLHNKSHLAETI